MSWAPTRWLSCSGCHQLYLRFYSLVITLGTSWKLMSPLCHSDTHALSLSLSLTRVCCFAHFALRDVVYSLIPVETCIVSTVHPIYQRRRMHIMCCLPPPLILIIILEKQKRSKIYVLMSLMLIPSYLWAMWPSLFTMHIIRYYVEYLYKSGYAMTWVVFSCTR
jgi:hypothetical protein